MSDHEKNEACCCSRALCDPRRPIHRFLILFITCLLCIGPNYCDDTSGALQDAITTDMNVSTAQFSRLYSWYAYPNVILCFVGGFLIDRVFGIRWGGIIFSFLVLIGQNVIALGAFLKRFWIMELGNVIFGAGTQSLNVVIYMYIVNWFKGKELNMALGLESAIMLIVASVNLAFTPVIYFHIPHTHIAHIRLAITIFIMTAPCFMSHICSFILAFYEQKAEKVLHKTTATTGEIARLADVKDFPVSFWLITIMYMTYYSSFFTLVGLGKIFFARKYKMTDISGINSSNTIDSALYFIPAIVSTAFGFLLDKTGRNLVWLLIALVLTILSLLGLGFTSINPWILVIIIGLCFPITFANTYALVAFVVPAHQLGTAYGILVSANNLGFAIVTMTSGMIIETKGFIFFMILLIDLLCVSLIASVLLYVINSSNDGMLNMSIKEQLKRITDTKFADEQLMSYGSIPGLTTNDDDDDMVRYRILDDV